MKRTLFALLMVLFAVRASAVITELRTVDGKEIMCVRTGLSSSVNDCGASRGYTYVFLGSITAISSAEHHEKELQVSPQEIFSGNPPASLKVLTSQCACLPKLIVGDVWLFFLREDADRRIVLDYSGNPSLPAVQAEREVAALRDLKNIGEFGVVRGRVLKGTDHSNLTPVPSGALVAARLSDRRKFVAAIDGKGQYEFPALPPGRYKLSLASDIDSGKSEAITAVTPEVTSGSCWDMSVFPHFKMPDARLGGHIRHADGSPAAHSPVLIAREDGSWFGMTKADADGYFHAEVLLPGRYFVGTQFSSGTEWQAESCAGDCLKQVPEMLFYYPGLVGRSNALIIDLGKDEIRRDIDITVSTQH